MQLPPPPRQALAGRRRLGAEAPLRPLGTARLTWTAGPPAAACTRCSAALAIVTGMGAGREIRRLGKFSAVGGVAFVVDIALFNALRIEALGIGPIWAKVASVAAATLVAWLGSRYWTFKDGKTNSPALEAVGFFAVNGAGLLLAVACLWFSNHVLGLTSALADNVSGNIVGAALGNVFRYSMYRFVLYRPRGEHRPPRRQRVDLEEGERLDETGASTDGAEAGSGRG